MLRVSVPLVDGRGSAALPSDGVSEMAIRRGPRAPERLGDALPRHERGGPLGDDGVLDLPPGSFRQLGQTQQDRSEPTVAYALGVVVVSPRRPEENLWVERRLRARELEEGVHAVHSPHRKLFVNRRPADSLAFVAGSTGGLAPSATIRSRRRRRRRADRRRRGRRRYFPAVLGHARLPRRRCWRQGTRTRPSRSASAKTPSVRVSREVAPVPGAARILGRNTRVAYSVGAVANVTHDVNCVGPSRCAQSSSPLCSALDAMTSAVPARRLVAVACPLARAVADGAPRRNRSAEPRLRHQGGQGGAPQPGIVHYALCHRNVSTELGLTFRECSKRSMSAAQGESLQASPSTWLDRSSTGLPANRSPA